MTDLGKNGGATCSAPPVYPRNDELATELRDRVEDYMKSSPHSRQGDHQLVTRAWTLIGLWWALYFGLLFLATNALVAIVLATVGGVVSVAMLGMGHNAMHGMLNGASLVKSVSILMLNVIGLDARWWRDKHHLLHHRYPNVYGFDDDLDHDSLIRMSKPAPGRPWHRFQHLYVWFLYPFTYLAMLITGDLRYLVSGKMCGKPVGQQGRPALLPWLRRKLYAISVLVLIPLTLHSWEVVMPVLLVWALSTGFILAILFVGTHTVAGTRHYQPGPDNLMPFDRQTCAISGSADVGVGNWLITWLFGGVTVHVAHHLYPGISATHYPAITVIIREICADRGIPYISFSGFIGSTRSHFTYLKARAESTEFPGPVVRSA